ncbi:MAG: hypothetical protein ACKO6C_04540 [Alphaproteobacteria bacterium]
MKNPNSPTQPTQFLTADIAKNPMEIIDGLKRLIASKDLDIKESHHEILKSLTEIRSNIPNPSDPSFENVGLEFINLNKEIFDKISTLPDPNINFLRTFKRTLRIEREKFLNIFLAKIGIGFKNFKKFVGSESVSADFGYEAITELLKNSQSVEEFTEGKEDVGRLLLSAFGKPDKISETLKFFENNFSTLQKITNNNGNKRLLMFFSRKNNNETLEDKLKYIQACSEATKEFINEIDAINYPNILNFVLNSKLPISQTADFLFGLKHSIHKSDDKEKKIFWKEISKLNFDDYDSLIEVSQDLIEGIKVLNSKLPISKTFKFLLELKNSIQKSDDKEKKIFWREISKLNFDDYDSLKKVSQDLIKGIKIDKNPQKQQQVISKSHQDQLDFESNSKDLYPLHILENELQLPNLEEPEILLPSPSHSNKSDNEFLMADWRPISPITGPLTPEAGPSKPEIVPLTPMAGPSKPENDWESKKRPYSDILSSSLENPEKAPNRGNDRYHQR